MLLRILSAVSHSLASNPKFAPVSFFLDFAICSVTSRVKSDALRARTKPPVTAVRLGRKAAG